ncbi:MAG: SchA/CurD [Pseudonocardia sp.]|nr:SchA/CurD [Pseudonocardia sp.]
MAYAAITYDILPGHEDEIAEIFGDFRRVGTSTVPGPDGVPAGSILATALFIRDDLMVRMIEYEGDIKAVARFMATAPGIQEVERKLKPFLRSPRDTDTVEGFVRTFLGSQLRCISQLAVPRPAMEHAP